MIRPERPKPLSAAMAPRRFRDALATFAGLALAVAIVGPTAFSPTQ
jgi:hypothetical protein